MKFYFKITAFILIFISIFFTANIQSKNEPFADLIKHLNNQDVKNDEEYGWENDRLSNAKIFNDIRKKLGKNFESKLLEFISDRIPRHYNGALFVADKEYLNGSEPLPLLAAAILEQGIILIQKQENEIIRTEEISFRVAISIIYQRYGLQILASHHKKNAIKLFKKGGIFSTAFPVLDNRDRQTYDSIPTVE